MKGAFIVTNYNKQNYIALCLKSLLSQKVDEGIPLPLIFLYDDGSTDNSKYIIEKIIKENPGRIIYESSNTNKGISYGFNKLHEMVLEYNKKNPKVEMIMISGSDDVSTEFRTMLTINKFIESDSDIVYGSFIKMDSMFQPIETKIVEPFENIKESMKTLKMQSIPHGFMAFKIKCIKTKYNMDRKYGVDHQYIIDLMDKGYTFTRIEPMFHEVQKNVLINPLGYYILNNNSVSIKHYQEIYEQDKKYFEDKE